ncbi:hypothetical protein P8452_41553 [Trifolium repens]|nr:hypothetical protein P8452_41553 [Trifolium repens]
MHILILNVTKPWKETGLKWMNYISGVNTVNKTDSSSFDVCSSPPSTSAFRRRHSSTCHRHCSSSTQMVPKMAH